MDIDFKGEHLLPGQIGQFFIILSFGAALLSFFGYYFATTDDAGKPDSAWQKLGRIGFYLNGVSILGIGVCLFYIIYNHFFEYHYAWAYTSRSLPVRYVISAFWNGQEGGFLLWLFWQAVLGLVLIRKSGTWERPVMSVMALSQLTLATMVLGVEIFSIKLGSSPFLLLRNDMEGPIFSNPNYMSFIKDGQGMVPSLQNYWMIIHPPTLFLGFAATVVPFAYGIAGLWQKRYKEWIQPAIPYTLFACMILGTGVVMGSFWAYESLNFGGFWAWDPVENASIFPWITMVAALHVLIVFKNTGHSYFTATFLVLISFVLTWYSSFLNRSGILGDTSVHSFTDLGMFWQLVTGVLIFLALSVWFLVKRWKQLPITKKDEETYSREFWMFVGAVFLGLSCFHLIVVTSIPVWNAIFHTKIAPPADAARMRHYNVIQSSFVFVITMLTAVTQFLKYKKTDITRFFITTAVYLVFAGLIAALIVYATGLYKLNFVFVLVMWGSVYSVIANGKILADAFKGKWKLAGSAVAHIGFGLLMVGALISAGTSTVISVNSTGEGFSAEFDKEQNPRENILVYRNEPVKMGDYTVTYTGDSIAAPNHFYKVNYKQLDSKGKIVDEFTLLPKAQVNKGALAASPDTRHYLFHDLYTHITMTNSISPSEEPGREGDGPAESDDKAYDAPVAHEVQIGDTIPYREGYIVLKKLNKGVKVENIPLKADDISVGAELEIVSHGKTYSAEPVYLIKGKGVFDFAKKVDDAGLKLRFSKILPDKNKVEITVYQQPESQKKYIVMKAIKFPYINFFWAGTIIMVIGFFMSILRRNKETSIAVGKS